MPATKNAGPVSRLLRRHIAAEAAVVTAARRHRDAYRANLAAEKKLEAADRAHAVIK